MVYQEKKKRKNQLFSPVIHNSGICSVMLVLWNIN